MQKTISIILSFLLLMSGTQLAFGQHFCEGKVVEEGVMVGQKKMSCAALGIEDTCIDEIETDKADCCIDIFHNVQTDSEYSGSHFEMPQQQFFNANFIPFYFSLQPIASSSEALTISEYLPPPLEKDIQVFYQTFLI